MGKVLPSIKNDNEALAQWLYRKLRNHDPMSARVLVANSATQIKAMVPVMGLKVADSHLNMVSIDQADPTKIYYQLGDGRVFSFQVEEVDTQTQIETEKEMVTA